MLIFDRTYITGFSRDFIIVNWTIKPTNDTISSFKFTIYRSSSTDGPWVIVGDDIINDFSFKDASVDLISEWRKYYYKIRVTEIAIPANFAETAPFVNEVQEPDRIAEEIIRRNEIILNSDDFVGRDVYVFIRKTYGQHCTGCWDYIKQRKVSSECRICFNTGYVGGYFTPVRTRMNINPSSDTVRHAQFEMQPNQTAGWMSNVPLISPADIVVEDNMSRWRVVQVQKTEKRRVVVHQTLLFTKVNRSDIEWELPIPDEALL